jgi:cob(I)alamin adenosyltransferase
MKIYTKKGDQGETGLFGGSRVQKTHPRIEAYGTLDELNSSLGVVRALLAQTEGAPLLFDGPLHHIQNALFQLGAEMATPPGATLSLKKVDAEDISKLEALIDVWDAELMPLKNFILPGGTLLAAHLQFARTVCRRSERRAVELAASESVRLEVLQYLNRLSDLLFVMGRKANELSGVTEHPWEKT